MADRNTYAELSVHFQYLALVDLDNVKSKKN